MTLWLYIFYGDPNLLALFQARLDLLKEPRKSQSTVGYAFGGLANSWKQATFRIFSRVSGMDPNAFEPRHIQQQRQRPLEPGRLCYNYTVSAGRNSRLPINLWPIPLSFAYAVLRAQGLMSAHREKATIYLAHLLGSSAGVLPAAYIVAEALDAPCADRFLNGLKALPLHSLHIDWEAPEQSAQAIAISLESAEGGFEWFYGQYLDPRYPFMHRGSGIVERIFAAWAALPRTRL